MLVARTQLTVRLPLDLHERIREAAEVMGVPVNEWCVVALRGAVYAAPAVPVGGG